LSRERGFCSVAGKVCLILDADETLPAHNTLERFLEPFADPAVAGVGGIKLPMEGGWVSDGLQVIRRTVYAARLQPNGTTEMVVGGAMALRVKAVNDVGGLTKNPNVGEDTDISWRLRKAGWKLIGCNDLVILHRDPTTLIGAYSDGYKQGKRVIHICLKHPRKILFWKTWTRFYPLGIIALLLFNRKAGLGLTGFSALFTVWMFRLAPASFVSKARGWLIWTITNLGWSLGFFAGIVTWIRKERIFN
jgi:cellulose synthase/poly-beta-1,6-N-acetylglucosamine synthase-like glycosyltransferase